MAQCANCFEEIEDDLDSQNVVKIPGRRTDVTAFEDETRQTVEGLPTYYHRRCPS
jgi:hypothetical protein